MDRIEVGKLPPQAVILEEAVLGAIMLEAECVDIVIGFLKPESFYNDHHRKIYSACLNLKGRGSKIDILTVIQELKRMGELESVGGAYYVTRLTNRVASAGNVDAHAHIVQEKFLAREVIRIASEKITLAYDESTDTLELVDSCERDFKALQPKGNVTQTVKEAYAEMYEDSQRAFNNNGKIGLTTHLDGLNKIMDGFVPGLYICGARPSIGKSSLLKSLTLSLIKQKIKVKIFSLEVKNKINIRSLLSEQFGINSNHIKKGQVSFDSWQEFEKFRDEYLVPYFKVDHTPAISIHYLRREIKKAIEWGAEFIGVDYIQLMKVNRKDLPTGATREQEISFLSSNMKQLSAEFDIPIFCNAQLGRKVEERTNKKPEVSDLREGGSLEQDADAIILIHRPEHYGILETKPNGKNDKDFVPVDLRGKAMLIVGKQRDGAIGEVKCLYRKETTSFMDDLGFAPYGSTTTETEEPIF